MVKGQVTLTEAGYFRITDAKKDQSARRICHRYQHNAAAAGRYRLCGWCGGPAQSSICLKINFERIPEIGGYQMARLFGMGSEGLVEKS